MDSVFLQAFVLAAFCCSLGYLVGGVVAWLESLVADRNASREANGV